MQDQGTTRYEMNIDQTEEAEVILREVLDSLREMGYDPIGQLVVTSFPAIRPTLPTTRSGRPFAAWNAMSC